ncbi:MAG TPA: TIGR03435 family protein [Vicinamibacterales bacterium]|jgi:uncharacterized protein (TIGR03435 family)
MRSIWLAIAVSAVGAAQTADIPAFEVATIKPSDGSSPMALQRVGNRIVTSNTPLSWLIKWSFDLDDDRLIGSPKGADSARFDVTGQAPDGVPAPGRLQAMMRTLLADRFHLAVHRETRRLTAYALVRDGAPKFKLSSAADRPAPNPFSMSAAGKLTGRQVTTAMLAKVLASQLTRSVEDMTGLDGVFDLTLEWATDSADTAADPSRPSLFTAIREQLGLRLEPRQRDVDVVVVDHVDLVPTAN